MMSMDRDNICVLYFSKRNGMRSVPKFLRYIYILANDTIFSFSDNTIIVFTKP